MEPDEWSVPAIEGTEGQAGNPAAAPSSRLAMISGRSIQRFH